MKASIAVGLSHPETSLLTLKGISENVDLIVKLARAHNVPVVESPKLARLLFALPVDQEIPAELLRPLEVLLEGLG